jgi:hypothetical protein
VQRRLREFSGGAGFTLRAKMLVGIWFPFQHLIFKSALIVKEDVKNTTLENIFE